MIIFRGADGRTVTMEDLRRATGTFRWEVGGGPAVPAGAEVLHQQGRQAGAAGDHKRALELFERASNLAPWWAYPVYDMAFTYLLMGEANEAKKYYRKTLELEPRGFFTAFTAVDTLVREEKGELPEDTYLAYISLESLDDPVKKASILRLMVEQVPGFAPGWKELAYISLDDVERRAAIGKGLAANPDSETKGMLQIYKARMMDAQGDHDGARRLLEELVVNPESTRMTEHLAKTVLELSAKN